MSSDCRHLISLFCNSTTSDCLRPLTSVTGWKQFDEVFSLTPGWLKGRHQWHHQLPPSPFYGRSWHSDWLYRSKTVVLPTEFIIWYFRCRHSGCANLLHAGRVKASGSAVGQPVQRAYPVAGWSSHCQSSWCHQVTAMEPQTWHHFLPSLPWSSSIFLWWPE